MASNPVKVNTFGIFFLFVVGFIFGHGGPEFTDAKEIEPTKNWQLVKEDDTVPAGFHVKMDMTTGEKWVKILDTSDVEFQGKDNNRDGKVSVAIVETNGDVKIKQNGHEEAKLSRNSQNYNFEMMYRTLSKLPPDELEVIGGLPEFQDENDGPSRVAFEERLLEIWKKRQAELLDHELNFPEVLKARILGIKEYIGNPEIHLEILNLDSYSDDDTVTDIVSLLKDLEFQLSDIDMARDFHTMDGWPLLIMLLLEDTHLTGNKTIYEMPASISKKIRTIQSHAAWAIGTAVKNTEEFFPYGLEFVVIKNIGKFTAIDVLIKIFCAQYDDWSWGIRTLQVKAIYAIGAILRGNHLAISHISKSDGLHQLGNKFRELSQQELNSTNTKLIHRMASLSTDIVDLVINAEVPDTNIDVSIINSISSAFCDATCLLLSSDTFLPVTLQETIVKGVAVMGPYCQSSNCRLDSILYFVEMIKSDWLRNKESFDVDHIEELLEIALKAIQSLGAYK